MLSFVYLFVVGIRHYHWVPFVRGEENPRRNRGIDTFSEEECWRNFRFRKPDLIILFQLLQVPFEMRVIGGRNGFKLRNNSLPDVKLLLSPIVNYSNRSLDDLLVCAYPRTPVVVFGKSPTRVYPYIIENNPKFKIM